MLGSDEAIRSAPRVRRTPIWLLFLFVVVICGFEPLRDAIFHLAHHQHREDAQTHLLAGVERVVQRLPCVDELLERVASGNEPVGARAHDLDWRVLLVGVHRAAEFGKTGLPSSSAGADGFFDRGPELLLVGFHLQRRLNELDSRVGHGGEILRTWTALRSHRGWSLRVSERRCGNEKSGQPGSQKFWHSDLLAVPWMVEIVVAAIVVRTVRYRIVSAYSWRYQRIASLIRKAFDALCDVEHRLLIIRDEAVVRPVEIDDQIEHERDQQSHDEDWQPCQPGIDGACIADKPAGRGRKHVKHHQYDARNPITQRRKAHSLRVDHLIERLDEETGRNQRLVLFADGSRPFPQCLLDGVRALYSGFQVGERVAAVKGVDADLHILAEQFQALGAMRFGQEAGAQRRRANGIRLLHHGIAARFEARQCHRKGKADDQRQEPDGRALQSADVRAVTIAALPEPPSDLTYAPDQRDAAEEDQRQRHIVQIDHRGPNVIALRSMLRRSTSKMTAVDHPNISAPFIAVSGPSSFQRSTVTMSP